MASILACFEGATHCNGSKLFPMGAVAGCCPWQQRWGCACCNSTKGAPCWDSLDGAPCGNGIEGAPCGNTGKGTPRCNGVKGATHGDGIDGSPCCDGSKGAPHGNGGKCATHDYGGEGAFVAVVASVLPRAMKQNLWRKKRWVIWRWSSREEGWGFFALLSCMKYFHKNIFLVKLNILWTVIYQILFLKYFLFLYTLYEV